MKLDNFLFEYKYDYRFTGTSTILKHCTLAMSELAPPVLVNVRPQKPRSSINNQTRTLKHQELGALKAIALID